MADVYGTLEHWNIGTLEPWNLEPWNAGSWNRGSPGEFAVMRRRRHRYRVFDPELKHFYSRLKTEDPGLRAIDSRLRTKDSRLRTKDSRLRTKDLRLRTKDLRLSHPRDWPTITCSVGWLIKRDRDKDRLKTLLKAAKIGGEGEVCSGVKA